MSLSCIKYLVNEHVALGQILYPFLKKKFYTTLGQETQETVILTKSLTKSCIKTGCIIRMGAYLGNYKLYAQAALK